MGFYSKYTEKQNVCHIKYQMFVCHIKYQMSHKVPNVCVSHKDPNACSSCPYSKTGKRKGWDFTQNTQKDKACLIAHRVRGDMKSCA